MICGWSCTNQRKQISGCVTAGHLVLNPNPLRIHWNFLQDGMVSKNTVDSLWMRTIHVVGKYLYLNHQQVLLLFEHPRQSICLDKAITSWWNNMNYGCMNWWYQVLVLSGPSWLEMSLLAVSTPLPYRPWQPQIHGMWKLPLIRYTGENHKTVVHFNETQKASAWFMFQGAS